MAIPSEDATLPPDVEEVDPRTEPNLSAAMQWLNGTYTGRFNRRRSVDAGE